MLANIYDSYYNNGASQNGAAVRLSPYVHMRTSRTLGGGSVENIRKEISLRC